MMLSNTERLDSMEFSQEYHYYLKDFKHIYFCRDCLRNFNTKVRVERCNKCHGKNIVELPSRDPLPQKKSFRSSLISQIVGSLLIKTKLALIFIHGKVLKAFIEIRGKLRVFLSNTRRIRNFASQIVNHSHDSYNTNSKLSLQNSSAIKSSGWSHKEELPTDISY